MLEYHCTYDANYPEKPDRILKPYERCKFYNLVDKCVEIKVRFYHTSCESGHLMYSWTT